MRSRDNQAEFGGYDDGRDGLFMASEGSAWRRCLTLADDGLRPGVPVPEEDGAVRASGSDVAVGGDVAFAAR